MSVLSLAHALCKMVKFSASFCSQNQGAGIVAGGAARAVLEIAGVKDIISKSLGSNTKVNVAKATLEALQQQRTAEQIAEMRGKKVEEL